MNSWPLFIIPQPKELGSMLQGVGCRDQIWGHRIVVLPAELCAHSYLHQPTWAFSPGWHHSRSPSAAEAGPAAPAQGPPGASGTGPPAGTCERHPGGPTGTGRQLPRGRRSHPRHPAPLAARPAGTHRRHRCGEGGSVWEGLFLHPSLPRCSGLS